MESISIELNMAIVKGLVINYALNVADLNRVSKFGLIKIFNDLAKELEKSDWSR